MNKPETFYFPQVKDSRGNLSFIEGGHHIPFEIKRIYYIYDVPAGESRGAHAHNFLQQVFVAISGSFFIDLDDGLGTKQTFFLSNPNVGLFVPGGYWRSLYQFSSGSSCMVLASLPYDEGDYIRDYATFLAKKRDA
ncbi:WxcM-like domain-containing protein [bacterium]|nr:WxcM-like domain-containing protein [bacterium]